MPDLFDRKEGDPADSKTPLADRMRPRDLSEFVGQSHLLSPGKLLRELIERDEIPSMIFFGPPGTGKTTLARIIAKRTGSLFLSLSAVLSGVKEVKGIMAEAERERKFYGRSTILFIDEIHRFNKAQQDAFLPYVERGDIILIGATTENPSFEVIGPLLSRCRVFLFEPLSVDEVVLILERALADAERGLAKLRPEVSPDMLRQIAVFSGGDARRALSTLELAVIKTEPATDGIRRVGERTLEEVIERKILLYDKGGEEHYNLISALHKSIRNSDPDAALYWLARMLEAGEDPLYIARRLIRVASEDVGLADPDALPLAVSAYQAVHFIGMPECDLALAEAVVYLSQAPKSNALYTAMKKVKKDVKEKMAEPVPMHLRNDPTELMKKLGYSKGYLYAHNFPEGVAPMDCLPPSLLGRKYYHPTDRGFEERVKERLTRYKQLKDEMKKRGISKEK